MPSPSFGDGTNEQKKRPKGRQDLEKQKCYNRIVGKQGKTEFGWLRVNDPGNIPLKDLLRFLRNVNFSD